MRLGSFFVLVHDAHRRSGVRGSAAIRSGSAVRTPIKKKKKRDCREGPSGDDVSMDAAVMPLWRDVCRGSRYFMSEGPCGRLGANDQLRIRIAYDDEACMSPSRVISKDGRR